MKTRFIVLLLFSLSLISRGSAAELHSELASGNFKLEVLKSDTRELKDRTVYYLTNNLEFVGANAADGKQAGSPGLAVASNATVYIAIPEGMKLTCRGGTGFAATVGGNASSPAVTNYEDKLYRGLTNHLAIFNIPAGGAAGTSASGGGPGILVPKGSKLAVYGKGTLNCQGGAGGAAASGGLGASGKYYVLSSFSPTRGQPPSGVLCSASEGVAVSVSGNFTGYDTGVDVQDDGQPASGAGGGGGGGGGGAAIGGVGAFGSYATAGAASTNLFRNGTVSVCLAVEPVPARSPDEVGEVYLNVAVTNLIGGVGGSAATNGIALVKITHSGRYYCGTKITDIATNDLFFCEGQPGGAGGAGGTGAAVGRGGCGGVGGRGGDSGSLVDTRYFKAKTYLGESMVGDSGAVGTNSTGTVTKLEDDKRPYNLVGFDALTPCKYSFLSGKTLTLPATTNDIETAGWKLAQAATTAPGLPTGSTVFLPTGTNVYDAASTVTLAPSTYGDVMLRSRPLQVIISNSVEAAILIPTNGAFAKTHLAGKTVAGKQTFLNGIGDNKVVRWQSYVAGLDVTNEFSRLALDVAIQSMPTNLCLQPKAFVASNRVEALNSHLDAGFDLYFDYERTLALTQRIWSVVGTVTNSVSPFEIRDVGSVRSAFYRLMLRFGPKSEKED